MTEEDPCLEALSALGPKLLHLLAMLEFAGRHLHPPNLPALERELEPLAGEVRTATEAMLALEWPEPIVGLRDRIAEAATLAGGACAGLRAEGPDDVLTAYRALRRATQAQEALWPLAAVLPPFSRYFLERDLPDSVTGPLLARAEVSAGEGRPNRGLFHIDNERDARGGCTIYVPEWMPDTVPMPLVMALHGGSGHGRDFVFSWLREARTRGCIVIAPTSAERTWSFPEVMPDGVDRDAGRLFSLVDQVRGLVPVDEDHMLLTGMSDGGSYTLMAGLRDDSPFTDLAPFSCVLSPALAADGRLARARDRRVRWVHGALDWMFPPMVAQDGVLQLEQMGGAVEYVEHADLSHTYAREESARTLDWLGVPQDRSVAIT